MTPLDLTRLASSAAGPASVAGAFAPPRPAARSRWPACLGPLPLSAAVGPAGGAGVLIRILRLMLVIGAVRNDVIGSYGAARRFGVAGVAGVAGILAARARRGRPGRLTMAALERSPDR